VIGISYPPSALFLIAFGFVILLLLNFSVAVSRLTDQSKVLAQQLALLDERVRRQEEREALASEAAELERTQA
jgi:predicted ATP-grasp superfamily ATP-dependent carboligase